MNAAMDYSDRRLTSVEIWGLRSQENDDGTMDVGGNVAIQISRSDGTDHGPDITIQMAIATSPDATLVQAEKDLLSAALGVLARASRESAKSLHEMLVEKRGKPLLPQKP
jgi:hypothetical protein